jgi:hypothetical protein
MSHPAAGTLRAYRDDQLAPGLSSAVRRHVAICVRCAATLAEVDDDAMWADAALRAVAVGREQPAPAGAASAPAGEVWRRLAETYGPARHDGMQVAAPVGTARPGGQPSSGPARLRFRFRWSGGRAAAAGAALLSLLSLGLQPVRAAVSNAFSIFQVQQVRVVTVSPSDMAQIRTQLRSALASGAGRIDLKGLASVSINPPGARPQAVSLAVARQLVPFRLEVAAPPPAGYALASVRVQPRTAVTVVPHVAAFNQLLASLGSTDRLPASLDGQTIRVEEPAAVVLTYSATSPASPATPSGSAAPSSGTTPATASEAIRVMEAAGPTVRVPQGVDVAAVRQALRSRPLLPPDVQQQIAAISDWQQTAVVPAVAGRDQAVTVGGAQGIFTPASRPGGPSVLIWLSGGVVRAVAGPLTQTQALAVAGSLR